MSKEDFSHINDAAKIHEGTHQKRTLFHEFYIQKGGILKPNKYKFSEGSFSLYNYQKVIEWRGSELSSLLKSRGCQTEIYINFIDNPSINAQVDCVSDNLIFIALYSGLFIRLEAFVSFITQNLTQPTPLSIAPFFDPVNKETNFTQKGPAWKDDIAEILFFEEINKNPRKELELLCNKYQQSDGKFFHPIMFLPLGAIGCEIVLYHEIAHALHGHVKFFKKFYEVSFLNETGEGNDIGKPESKLAEYVADLNSSFYVSRHCFDSGFPNIEFDFPAGFDSELDLPPYLYLLAYVVSLLYALFDMSSARIEQYYGKRHPHPEVRLCSFFDGVKLAMEAEEVVEKDLYLDMMHMGFYEAVRALERAGMGGFAFPYSTNRRRNFVGDFAGNNFQFSSEIMSEVREIRSKSFQFDDSIRNFHLPALTALR